MTTIATKLLAVLAVGAAAFTLASPATAQQNRDATLHKCIVEAQRAYPSTTPDADEQRTALYKACMSKAGFAP